MMNLVLFGPPGAGKGTQAEKIIEKYRLVHFSTGDILRNEIKNNTKLGLEAKKYMDQGNLVPDEVVIGMIQNKIDENLNAKGFIFDGFPRTTAQAKALDNILNQREIPISIMLSLEVEKEELIKRLLLRGKDSGRADDKDESIIENRIKVYNEETAPVIGHYDGQGKYMAIPGMGSIDEIFENISKVLDSLNA